MRIVPTYAVVVAVGLYAGIPQDEVARPTRSIHTPIVRFALERAMRAVLERLERPECRKVLTEFRDADGRTINRNLESLGETPRSYLARIAFREALDGTCRDATKIAFARVGRQEVFICGIRFWRVYEADPPYAEALLIHEMMHTLGLGENPPSSLEITTRVLKRCG
jgi:hypothetical protein